MLQLTSHPGTAALQQVQQSFERRSNPRLILMGDAKKKVYVQEALEISQDDGRSPEQVLAAATDPARDCAGPFLQVKDDDIEAGLGKWTTEPTQPSDGFMLNLDLNGRPLKKALVAEIPCEESWHIPAHVGFGNWNDCPPPEDHCALWRVWEERFDAHIIGISHDVVEAVVLRPPTERRAALELAHQQYLYCPDLVDQGMGEVELLAALLLEGRSWFFWWD